MIAWFAEYWYVVWGIIGTVILFGLNLYARRYPDTASASHWDRLRYAGYACAPISGILGLIAAALDAFAPSFSYFDALFSPYFIIGLFIFCWLVAPSLKRIIPLEHGAR